MKKITTILGIFAVFAAISFAPAPARACDYGCGGGVYGVQDYNFSWGGVYYPYQSPTYYNPGYNYSNPGYNYTYTYAYPVYNQPYRGGYSQGGYGGYDNYGSYGGGQYGYGGYGGGTWQNPRPVGPEPGHGYGGGSNHGW